MFILLFLLAFFLCVYEDNQSTTRNLKRTFRLLFLFCKSRACTVICQIKKQRAERLRVVGVSPSRKKTAVCTANDLNYCLHQRQTKKNINFLEKRESPTRDFFFLYLNAIVYTSFCNREIAIQICHYFSLFTLYRASSTSLPCRIARFTRESEIFSPFFAISVPEKVVRSFDSDLPRRNE